ncbi:hypothetical protein [Yersinia sp. 1652 StPb PI]|uniref:hypothetical protein n=1 Tax=Yersinia sp. 1652 StPb PI TaxID=3061649 RepID=UPI00355B45EE
MNRSDEPTKQPVPFGVNGQREVIEPDTTPGDNSASYNLGFPPITMILKTAGGLPPKGQDMNQVLFELSSLSRWSSAGALNAYDSAFSTAVNGYPKGSQLANSTFTGSWLNTVDGNTSNPESGTATGWVPFKNNGVTAITGLAAANVTLTALQASNDRVTLAGVLTANINVVFPAWLSKWIVTNNCTGNFTVTCKTASGTGVAIPVGTTAVVFSDGTNITLNGPLMVQAATNNNHAVNLGQGNAQWSPVVGASRNAKMSVTAASAIATFTADQLTVTTGLSGQPYLLTSFSKTINLATTGAGGMDTGTVPAAGFVALYAIYNPTTQVSALLAVNATSVLAPEVYGGANMPSGYTASALVSVWRTASSQFIIGYQVARQVSFQRIAILATSTQQASMTALNIPNYLPINAISCNVDAAVSSSTSTNAGFGFSSSASGIAWKAIAGYTTTGTGVTGQGIDLPIITPQTIYYSVTIGAGTLSFNSTIHAYEF